MNKLINVAVLAAGVLIGIAATKRYFKQKYAQEAEGKIASVKEAFADRKEMPQTEKEEKTVTDREQYAEEIRKNGYTDYSNTKEDATTAETDGPYVITPDEYENQNDYEKVVLTYYADKKLADEDFELVEAVNRTVGLRSLNHFGEYEEDTVYVRNDLMRCDFVITIDTRKWSDVAKTKPWIERS